MEITIWLGFIHRRLKDPFPTSKQEALMDSSVQFPGHSGVGGSEGVCP